MAERSDRFTVFLEQDEEGFVVTNVPELRGCHTKSKSLDILTKRAPVSPNTVAWGDEARYGLVTRFYHATDFSKDH